MLYESFFWWGDVVIRYSWALRNEGLVILVWSKELYPLSIKWGAGFGIFLAAGGPLARLLWDWGSSLEGGF